MNKTATDERIFFMLLKAGRAQFERLEEALRGVGLSSAKYHMLTQISNAGEALPLRVLAEGQGCVPSNVTTLVDRLEAEGLVRRVDDPDDRRSKRAELTPAGEEKVAAGAKVVAALEEAFAESLDPTERLALAKVLESLQ